MNTKEQSIHIYIMFIFLQLGFATVLWFSGPGELGDTDGFEPALNWLGILITVFSLSVTVFLSVMAITAYAHISNMEKNSVKIAEMAARINQTYALSEFGDRFFSELTVIMDELIKNQAATSTGSNADRYIKQQDLLACMRGIHHLMLDRDFEEFDDMSSCHDIINFCKKYKEENSSWFVVHAIEALERKKKTPKYILGELYLHKDNFK